MRPRPARPPYRYRRGRLQRSRLRHAQVDARAEARVPGVDGICTIPALPAMDGQETTVRHALSAAETDARSYNTSNLLSYSCALNQLELQNYAVCVCTCELEALPPYSLKSAHGESWPCPRADAVCTHTLRVLCEKCVRIAKSAIRRLIAYSPRKSTRRKLQTLLFRARFT